MGLTTSKRDLAALALSETPSITPGDNGFYPLNLTRLLILEHVGSPFVSGEPGNNPAIDVLRANFVLKEPLLKVESVLDTGIPFGENSSVADLDAAAIMSAKDLEIHEIEPLAKQISQHLAVAVSNALLSSI